MKYVCLTSLKYSAFVCQVTAGSISEIQGRRNSAAISPKKNEKTDLQQVEMLPSKVVLNFGISTVYLTGSSSSRNSVFVIQNLMRDRDSDLIRDSILIRNSVLIRDSVLI